MTRRSRTYLTAVTAVVLGSVSLLLGAGPASGGPVIFISSPGVAEVVPVANPTVVADVSPGVGGALTGPIRLTVNRTDGPQDPVVATKDPVNGQSSRVSFGVKLAHNGNYVAVVEATDDAPITGGVGRAERQFFVAAPPAVPSGVRAVGAGGGKVALAWNRNPEPDILRYRVERNAGDGPFTTIATSQEPTFTDPSPVVNAGYRVFAVRRGAGPTPELESGPSPRAAVLSGGGSGKGGAPAALNKVSLDKFAKLLADAKAKAAAAGQVEPGEDGAFDANLPYAKSAADDQELGSDEPIGAGRRTLPFVAGGLLALSTFLLLRSIRAQVDRGSPSV